jgi:hypothetical protein
MFLSPCCGFLLAFANAITVALQARDLGVMQQPIQQRGDAGGVGKGLVPFFERAIRSDDYGLAFVTAIDDLIEDVCGLIVER